VTTVSAEHQWIKNHAIVVPTKVVPYPKSTRKNFDQHHDLKKCAFTTKTPAIAGEALGGPAIAGYPILNTQL